MTVMNMPAERLGQGTAITVEILPTPEDVANDFARVMANTIRANNHQGRQTAFILPVGPTGQYSRLARICNIECISCRNLVVFNMDEYCRADGSRVSADHPMSFRGFMEREFYARLDSDKRVPDENKVFPDPADLSAVARAIAAAGGIDICFGGIGINGHIAFNEPPPRDEAMDADTFRNLGTRILDITPETRVVNAIYGAGGNLEAVPPKCVTIGMKEILSSRQLHFYLDWPWQAAVVRQAVHGPVTPDFPASFLQTHPHCTLTIASCVAALPMATPS